MADECYRSCIVKVLLHYIYTSMYLQILIAKNEELTIEVNSLKDLNQNLHTRLSTEDSFRQEIPNGASSHDQVEQA